MMEKRMQEAMAGKERTTPAKATLRDKIVLAEKVLSTYPQVVIEPKHYFVPGAYIREITIPADVMCTSKTHRTRHVSIMLSGRMSIPTEDGPRIVIAPRIEIGEAGSKRIGLALEDSRWITIHVTNETDLEKIEAEQFIDEEDTCVFDFATGKVKPDRQIEIDRADYRRMLSEAGISLETDRAQTENGADRIEVDLGPLGVEIRMSPIEGSGLFSRRSFPQGATIGPARLGGMRSQLGRYANHSCRPNGRMVMDRSGDVWLTSVREIREDEEITIDYRQALSLPAPAGPKEDRACLA